MPRYEVVINLCREIEADCEEDAIQNFIDTYDLNDYITCEKLEPPICGQCSGSGEGMHDGTRCLHCKGMGIEPEGEDDEDYDDGE